MMKTSSHDFYFRVYGSFPALGKENSSPRESKHVARIYLISRIHLISRQGGRCTPKGRSPNLPYFAAKLGFVTIYALFEKLSESFQWKSVCFQRASNEGQPAFRDQWGKFELLQGHQHNDSKKNCFCAIASILRKRWAILLRSSKTSRPLPTCLNI